MIDQCFNRRTQKQQLAMSYLSQHQESNNLQNLPSNLIIGWIPSDIIRYPNPKKNKNVNNLIYHKKNTKINQENSIYELKMRLRKLQSDNNQSCIRTGNIEVLKQIESSGNQLNQKLKVHPQKLKGTQWSHKHKTSVTQRLNLLNLYRNAWPPIQLVSDQCLKYRGLLNESHEYKQKKIQQDPVRLAIIRKKKSVKCKKSI